MFRIPLLTRPPLDCFVFAQNGLNSIFGERGPTWLRMDFPSASKVLKALYPLSEQFFALAADGKWAPNVS